VLISAGFDAHRADPLGGCRLESSDFARMARHVRDLARQADAPIGGVLEGSYDPPALTESLVATMRALTEDDPAESIAPAGERQPGVRRQRRIIGADQKAVCLG
jgi:acetoin utilization deacetylase AcuC-like enzyme